MKAAALLFGLSFAVSAQTRAAFEVASIKPHSGGDPSSTVRISGGRFSASNMTLKDLAKWAYQIRLDFLISGGPGWIESDRYDIAAKADSEAPIAKEQFPKMLQALLVDRFQLQSIARPGTCRYMSWSWEKWAEVDRGPPRMRPREA